MAILEHEKRKAEGTKNRVEIEADNTRKLLQIERGKTDEALEQMNKLVFFDDDLIHARDYNRLKQEMEEVLRENAAMFQDHQRYIIEAAQNRRQMTNRLEELEAELASLKLEAIQWAQKVEGFNTMSEDKLRLVKSQNEVVFLMRKAEESREVSLKQE